MLDGARELDLVAPLGLVKAGAWLELFDDLGSVIASGRPARVKIILETGALTPDEIVLAALVARHAGADWVKTSTGFHPGGGATVEAVQMLRLVAGDRMGVKASGGIRSIAEAARMLTAGADRIGASALEALATDRPLAELLS
jgi:deoxyribose-phosphate aldolase